MVGGTGNVTGRRDDRHGRRARDRSFGGIVDGRKKDFNQPGSRSDSGGSNHEHLNESGCCIQIRRRPLCNAHCTEARYNDDCGLAGCLACVS